MRRKLFASIYLILIGLLGISFLLPSQVIVDPSRVDLPAGGTSRREIRVQVKMPFSRRLFFPHPRIRATVIQGAEFVKVYPTQDVWMGRNGATFYLQSRAAEGEAVVRFSTHNARAATLRVLTRTVSTDSNGELHRR